LNQFLPCIVEVLATAQAAPGSLLSGPERPAYKGNAGLTGLSSDNTIRQLCKLAESYRLIHRSLF